MNVKFQDQKNRLFGKVAIVTGGSSGIGRAVCLALVREGAAVVVIGRNVSRIDATIAEIERTRKREANSVGSLGLSLDIRREADTEMMVNRVLGQFGRIDILVANAGILRAQGSGPRLLADLTIEEWDEVVDTNLKGVFLSNRSVLPTMIKQRNGQIINISSRSGRRALAFDSAYCASKFGVIGLSQALAEEVRSYGIRVQVLLPGPTETQIWAQNDPIPRTTETMPVDRVADLIIKMISLPEDTILEEPVIDPFIPHGRPSWIQTKRANRQFKE